MSLTLSRSDLRVAAFQSRARIARIYARFALLGCLLMVAFAAMTEPSIAKEVGRQTEKLAIMLDIDPQAATEKFRNFFAL